MMVWRIYVMSESVMVRELSKDRYLIRAGSKAFKSDAIFEAKHTHYDGAGKMLPTVVRFVGTQVATLALDPPRTGDAEVGGLRVGEAAALGHRSRR